MTRPLVKNPFEQDAHALADEMLAVVRGIPGVEVPFGGVRLTPDEQVERYVQMREDPAAWQAIVDKQGWKATWEYAQHMEMLLKRRAGPLSEETAEHGL